MLSASHWRFLTILVPFRVIGYTGNIFKTPRLLTIACIPAYTFALNCHCSFYSANDIRSCLFSPINKTNKQQTNTWLYEYVIALSATHSCFHITWLPSSMVAIPGPVLSAKLSRWTILPVHSLIPQNSRHLINGGFTIFHSAYTFCYISHPKSPRHVNTLEHMWHHVLSWLCFCDRYQNYTFLDKGSCLISHHMHICMSTVG